MIWSVIYPPPPSPNLEVFPEDKFGIIIAEFTQGSQERSSYTGGADLRDKIYNDVLRLATQQEIGNLIAIQQAGPIKNQAEALAVGQKYGAELVIWGYTPINQPNTFRPNFTILAINEDLQTIDPILFSADVIGEDTIEANALLTTRVRVVSNFVLGVIFLTDGKSDNLEQAVSIFDQTITEANDELVDNETIRSDLIFNLALFHLMRGRAYAALGEDESALEDYSKALEYQPNFARAHASIGNLYYFRREFSLAATSYEAAKSNWRGLYGLGLVNYYDGEFDLAIQYFDDASEMAIDAGILPSGDTEMQLIFVLGMAHKKAGNQQNADKYLSQVCSAINIPEKLQEGACLELSSFNTSTPTSTRLPRETPPQPTLAITPQPTPTSPLLPRETLPQFTPTSTQLPTPPPP